MAGMDRPVVAAPPERIDRDRLARLLAAAELLREVLREERPGLAGPLRVLRLAGAVLVQEETPAGEILIRSRPDLDQANAFVERRLRQYDKMWDG